MSLADMLSAERLRSHRTSRQEVCELLAIAQRGLSDACVTGISTDLRFSAAYDAALALATVVLYAAGYRTTGVGHHAATFEAVPLAMGDDLQGRADLFEACRTKRNVAQYRRVGAVSPGEVEALLAATEAFREQVTSWLRDHHPDLAPETGASSAAATAPRG